MLKKFLILMIMLAPFATKAQMTNGDWFTYPIYSDQVGQMAETASGKIYYLSGKNLFSYDKNSGETYSYTKRNLLNSNDVSSIHYNYDRKYLMVVYADCNIDLVFDNGKVVNLSDIKDAVMMTTKTINDVAFYKGRIYVATSFGLVVFDDKKFNVVESGIYNRKFKKVAVWRDNIYLYETNKISFSPINKPHYSDDSFKHLKSRTVVDMFADSDADDCLYIIVSDTDRKLYKVEHDAANNGPYSEKLIDGVSVANHWDGKSGFYALSKSGDEIYNVKNGVLDQTITIPSKLKGMTVTTYNSPANLWGVTTDGIGYYSVANGQASVGPFKPQAGSVQSVASIVPTSDYSKLYISNVGLTHNRPYGDGWQYARYVYTTLDEFSNGTFRNVNPHPVTRTQPVSSWDSSSPSWVILAPGQLTIDKDDPDMLYIASGVEGIYKVKNGKQIYKYDSSNSPLRSFGSAFDAVCVYGVAVDRGGNLWVLGYNGSKVALFILPYSATKKATVTESDWKSFNIPEIATVAVDMARDSQILVCKESNMVYVLCGYYSTALVAFDTKGTFNDLSDDTYKAWTKVSDQDGKDFSFVGCVSICEDRDGKVWVSGNATGVLEISDHASLLTSNPKASRVKVPRNDGTDYADYLLDTEYILSMSTDPSNRKWIATQNSGAYLVSPTGDEIIDQFNSNNSYLPVNQVNVVYADPLSNNVYMGTQYGLTVYTSDAAPAAENFSEVYAYPNPVRPEYTGWITINNLMDNSLVKIGDAMGNIVNTGRSQGGMYMWDGCDNYGNRVKSGVYFVYASTGPDDNSRGAVATKILVVN